MKGKFIQLWRRMRAEHDSSSSDNIKFIVHYKILVA